MAWWPREMFEARARMRDHVCRIVGSTLEEREEGGLACFSTFSGSISGLDSPGSSLTFRLLELIISLLPAPAVPATMIPRSVQAGKSNEAFR